MRPYILFLLITSVSGFTIALHQPQDGIIALEQRLLHISNPASAEYGQWLTLQEVQKYTTPYDRTDVIDWIKSLKISCKDYGDAFTCTGTKPTIPDHLTDKIDFIEHTTHQPKRNIKPTVSTGVIAREVLMRLYEINDTTTNGTVSVGVAEYAGLNGISNTQLNISQTANGVSHNPAIILDDEWFPSMEATLDIQTVYWAVNDAELYYDASLDWMYAWAVGFFNMLSPPEVMSISWGYNEADQCQITTCDNITSQQYVDRTNIEFMKIAARGVTLVVAAGDAGAPGRLNEQCENVTSSYGWANISPDFPASSPWVVSVGATYLVEDNSTYNYTTPICSEFQCSSGTEQRGVTYNETGWTSGSGFSLWTARPDWQDDVVTKYLSSGITLPASQYFNAQGRAYPDVAVVGHNCVIYMFIWGTLDGTSCSAPVFASIIANLNAWQKQRGAPVLGFVNPLLYAMKDTFVDVVYGSSAATEEMSCGSDFGFSAAVGWDPVGGLGTPDVNAMKEWLSLHF